MPLSISLKECPEFLLQIVLGDDFLNRVGLDVDHKDLAGCLPIGFAGKPEGNQGTVGKVYQPGRYPVVLEVGHALQGCQGVAVDVGVAELHFVNNLVDVASEQGQQ